MTAHAGIDPMGRRRTALGGSDLSRDTRMAIDSDDCRGGDDAASREEGEATLEATNKDSRVITVSSNSNPGSSTSTAAADIDIDTTRGAAAAPAAVRSSRVERGQKGHSNEVAVRWVQFLNTASFMSASVARMQVCLLPADDPLTSSLTTSFAATISVIRTASAFITLATVIIGPSQKSLCI